MNRISFNMKNGDPLPKQDNTQRRQKAQSVGHMQTLDFSGYTTQTNDQEDHKSYASSYVIAIPTSKENIAIARSDAF